MDLLPRLGISLIIFLIGAAFIVWATRISVFNGVLMLIEELLPDTLRSILRRVVNTFTGLVFIAVALLIFFLAGNRSSQMSTGSASTGSGTTSTTSSAPATRDAR